MMLSLHKNATTTPAIRAKIAASDEPAAVLAARYGVTLDTIYRWRGRTSFEDRPSVGDNVDLGTGSRGGRIAPDAPVAAG